MEGPRSPTENEFDRVLDFLNGQLRPDSQWSIAQEYPTALSTTNLHNMRIITENERILSHAVLKPLIVKTPHVVLKVGAIGSVVTDESARGQGLSTKIMNSCLDEAVRQNCDIAVLWTEIHDFYRRIGFELAGFEQTFFIENQLEVTGAKLAFRTTTQVDPEAIYRLMQKHTVMTHRSLEEVRRFLQIPNSTLYTAWSLDGRLEAFAVEGKGADLRDYVHEWAGSVSSLLQLFNFILMTKNRPFTVIAPRHSQSLAQAFEARDVLRVDGHLGMIKALNRPSLMAKVQRALGAYGGLPAEVDQLNDADFIRLLFGPHDEALTPILDFNPRIREILPLRFWLWGWDSI
ncbi:MAG: GNAT family N-acetyltransferase [Bdellovibrionaceae bacterium]|nr:GNAT family N-acetyltransferase [Pseudobdellovibrionaceae bacterium]